MHRRNFLRTGSAVAALLATGTLAACGDDDDTTSDSGSAPEPDGTEPPDTTGATTEATEATTAVTEETTEETTAPVEGGTVRVGMISSPADTLNPAATTGLLEYSTLFAIYDSLVLLKGDVFELQLAES
ncbi:MAG: hypothetical protein AAGA42_20830, partial [Actinomycetota bacterium]